MDITAAVSKLYDTYPFPPEPILDELPPGYNWRWSWPAAYNFCTGRKPKHQEIRILDAGCGTGVGTEYLLHLNPAARVVGIDISTQALQIAQKRCDRYNRLELHHLNIYEAARLPGQFDLINCVGVLHHLEHPQKGLQALAEKLAPGGIMHIFVYGELGRWEITLMQQAIALLQDPNQADYRAGVQIGRKLFEILPETNRLAKREKERWALENHRDECFADMYVHPQEIDYNIYTLFELIESVDLEFVGFSNPKFWQLDRLLAKAPELVARAAQLSPKQAYRLVELLDPEVSHYEFFLARPPLPKCNWADDQQVLAAVVDRNPCIDGQGQTIFDQDYQLVHLGPAAAEFLAASDGTQTVAAVMAQTGLEMDQVRSLLNQRLILLSPD